MASASPAPAPSALAVRIAELFPELTAGGPALPQKIAAVGMFRRAPQGSVMFNERTPCSGFPLLLSGTVRVVQRYPNGRELQLYRVKAGESCLLSGSCLLSDVDFQAMGIAETDLELIVLPPGAFHVLLGEEEAFRRHVFASFGARLAEMMEMVEAVAYRQLDRRLARLLVSSVDDDGSVKATHQALADGIGSVREMVSRLLGTFEDRQWVKLGRERVTILDHAALASLASS